MGTMPGSCHAIIHRFLRPNQLISFSLFKQPPLNTPLKTTPLGISLSPTHSFCSTPFAPHSLSSSQGLLESQNDAVTDNSNNDVEAESDVVVEGLKGLLDSNPEKDNINNNNNSSYVISNNNHIKVVDGKPPSLSVKEKKELASYAHSLGKKLKSQQIGKSGVTATVITALVETLEANELLKLKIHGNCPAEVEDVVRQVEEGTGSVVVGQIGRTVILYRPSLTKLKAVEKKKHAIRFLAKKLLPSKSSLQQSRGQTPRQSGRGRRGSSRV